MSRLDDLRAVRERLMDVCSVHSGIELDGDVALLLGWHGTLTMTRSMDVALAVVDMIRPPTGQAAEPWAGILSGALRLAQTESRRLHRDLAPTDLPRYVMATLISGLMFEESVREPPGRPSTEDVSHVG